MDPVTILSLIPTVIDLAQYVYKVTSTVYKVYSAENRLPAPYEDLHRQLPLIIQTLRRLELSFAGKGDVDEEHAITTALEGAQHSLQQLSRLMDSIVPSKGDSVATQKWKAFRLVDQEAKVTDRKAGLLDYVYILNAFHSIPDNTGTVSEDGTALFWFPLTLHPNLVGQDDLVGTLTGQLSGRNSCALVGMGGVGKTQIAVATCYRLRGHRPAANVLWLQAQDSRTFQQDCIKVARSLRLPGSDLPDANSPLLLSSWVRSQRQPTVMVIDNADDIRQMSLSEKQDDESPECTVLDMLQDFSGATLLLTTRDTRVAEKFCSRPNIFEVLPPALPDCIRILRVLVDESLWDEAGAADLIAALGNLPLAIRQAGAYVSQNRVTIPAYMDLVRASPGGVLESLDESSDDGNSSRDSVARSLNISIRHLRAKDADAFEMLACIALMGGSQVPQRMLDAFLGSKKESLKCLGLLIRFCLASRSKSGAGDVWQLHPIVTLLVNHWIIEEREADKIRDNGIRLLLSQREMACCWHRNKPIPRDVLPDFITVGRQLLKIPSEEIVSNDIRSKLFATLVDVDLGHQRTQSAMDTVRLVPSRFYMQSSSSEIGPIRVQIAAACAHQAAGDWSTSFGLAVKALGAFESDISMRNAWSEEYLMARTVAGFGYSLRSSLEEARNIFTNLIEECRAAPPSSIIYFRTGYYLGHLALLCIQEGDIPKAKSYLHLAAEYAEGPTRDSESSFFFHNFSGLFLHVADSENAIKWQRCALDRALEFWSPRDAVVLSEREALYAMDPTKGTYKQTMLRNVDEHIALKQKLYVASKEAYGDAHEATIFAKLQLASILAGRASKKHEKALDLTRSALKDLKVATVLSPLAKRDCLGFAAAIYMSLTHPQQALEVQSTLLKWAQESGQSVDYCQQQLEQCKYLCSANQPDEGMRKVRTWLATWHRDPCWNFHSVQTSRNVAADILYQHGGKDKTEALRVLRDLVLDAERVFGCKSQHTTFIQYHEVRLLVREGQLELARQSYAAMEAPPEGEKWSFERVVKCERPKFWRVRWKRTRYACHCKEGEEEALTGRGHALRMRGGLDTLRAWSSRWTNCMKSWCIKKDLGREGREQDR